MPKFRIRYRLFHWYEPETDEMGVTAPRYHDASLGEVVELNSDVVIERGMKLGAIEPYDGDAEVGERVEASESHDGLDSATMTADEMAVVIQERKLTAQQVIDAAQGDPEYARALLEAEELATDGESRKTVVEALSRIIAQG